MLSFFSKNLGRGLPRPIKDKLSELAEILEAGPTLYYNYVSPEKRVTYCGQSCAYAPMSEPDIRKEVDLYITVDSSLRQVPPENLNYLTCRKKICITRR